MEDYFIIGLLTAVAGLLGALLFLGHKVLAELVQLNKAAAKRNKDAVEIGNILIKNSWKSIPLNRL